MHWSNQFIVDILDPTPIIMTVWIILVGFAVAQHPAILPNRAEIVNERQPLIFQSKNPTTPT